MEVSTLIKSIDLKFLVDATVEKQRRDTRFIGVIIVATVKYSVY